MIQPADSASEYLKSVMHHVEGLRRECDAAAPWPLEVLLASELGRELKDRLRTVPIQRRSMQTVDRMFSATLEIALKSKDVGNLKIEDIAQTSGVTVQTAYRYAADRAELFFFYSRRVQAAEYLTLIRYVRNSDIRDAETLVDIIVGFAVHCFICSSFLPNKHALSLFLKSRHEIAYDMALHAATIIIEVAHTATERLRSVSRATATATLISAITLCKSRLIEDIDALDDPDVIMSIVKTCRAVIERS